jgi:hypothetical protein
MTNNPSYTASTSNDATSPFNSKKSFVETGTTFSFQTDKADDYIFVSHNPDWISEIGWSVRYSASDGSKPYSPYAIPVAIILSVTGAIVVVSGYPTKQKQIMPAVPAV